MVSSWFIIISSFAFRNCAHPKSSTRENAFPMNPEMKSLTEFRPNLIEITLFVSVLLLLSIKLSIFPNESGLQHVSPIPWTKTIKSCFCRCCCCPREQNGRQRRRPRRAQQKRIFIFIIININIAALLFCAPPCLLIARSFTARRSI